MNEHCLSWERPHPAGDTQDSMPRPILIHAVGTPIAAWFLACEYRRSHCCPYWNRMYPERWKRETAKPRVGMAKTKALQGRHSFLLRPFRAFIL